MIYEDLLVIWLAYLLWEFLPSSLNIQISSLYKVLIFIVKELLFILTTLFLRKRKLDRIFVFISFSFFALDITFFEIKKFLEDYYFSVFLGLFWFLHYYLWIRLVFYSLNLRYFQIFFAILLPFFILLFLDELFQFLNISFPGQFLFLLIIVLIFTPFIIVKIWPVERFPDSPLKEMIFDFLKKSGVKIKQIYILPSIGPKFYTAGLVGFIYPFRYLFFSKGLLEILTPEEILGVLAHEIGHLKRKHGFYLFLLLLTFPIFILNSMSLLLYVLVFLFSVSNIDIKDFSEFLKGPYGIYFEIFLAFWLFFFAFLFLRILFAYFLRSFEREADLFGLKLLKTPRPLVTALYKIGELTGQLYHKSWHHYGLWERILYLQYASENSLEIESHTLRIRKRLILWVFLNLILLVLLNFLDLEILKGILKNLFP
ncbi:MAG: M48 family metalloprotease [Caldimicrobium sp.]